MADVLKLQCSMCGREYALDAVQYTCPACGQVGTLDVLYDYAALRTTLDRDRVSASRVQSMWRYRDLLPLAPHAPVPPLRVGGTPLYHSPRLTENLCVCEVWVKDDGMNPTASLKDRASAMIVARALENGIDTVSTASTGNAAAALAGVGASVQHTRLNTIIFVPSTAPEAKIAQLLVYGATVLLVEASYDVAFDLCFEMCQRQGWYCRNTGINPYTAEGKKTAAYEIAEGFGWDVPDVVMVSVGDGNIIAGVHKGFYDLLQLGWITRIPRLIGVQAEGSSPLYRAWKAGISADDMPPEDAHTIADSISAGVPRDRAKALRAVRQTEGAFVSVTDAEIIAAIPKLARLTGVFAEPACAAVYAGAQRAVELGLLHRDERVALLLTGNGLKDVKRAQESVVGGIRVPPDLAAIRRALDIDEK
jgi:threonine synthase